LTTIGVDGKKICAAVYSCPAIFWHRPLCFINELVRGTHPTLAILRNLAKKWIKTLFALWSKGTSYNEALHIQNLKARNVPWAMAL